MGPRGYHAENKDSGQLKMVEKVHYDISVMILKQFNIIMILNEWEEQKVQLQYYGIEDTILPHENVNGQRTKKEISDEMREYLIGINEYDLMFYESAKEIANERTVCAATQRSN